MKLRNSGKNHAAKICKEAALSTPTRSTKMLKKLDKKTEIPLILYEALSILLSTNMSKSTYNYLRTIHRERNCTLYPSYKSLVEAKKTCYSPGINISDFKAEFPLKNLLDQTTSSLLISQKIVVNLFRSQSAHIMPLSFELISKYGFESSGNHSLYAMKYGNLNSAVSETNLFATFICPLKLVEKRSSIIVWENTAPMFISLLPAPYSM